MNLYMFYLGGNAGKSNIEVHDVQFVAAEKPEQAWPLLATKTKSISTATSTLNGQTATISPYPLNPTRAVQSSILSMPVAIARPLWRNCMNLICLWRTTPTRPKAGGWNGC
jgi:hypothetical protein